MRPSNTSLGSRGLPTLLILLAAAPLLAAPELAPIEDLALLGGAPLHIPLNGVDPDGRALAFSAESSDPELVATFIPQGNRNLSITVAGFGEMRFELLEARVPRATSRIIQLAESGFYDGIIFHRVINDFVIQGGDPTGTGTGGSELGPFDDQFHVDLQHNRSGLLSMAKSSDDTNDSQFFITEGDARHLDFNHTIFGLLVKGEEARDAISNTPTGADERPLTDVVMESVRVLDDGQNAVLMLKAPEGATGTAQVTVTVTDPDGTTVQQSFTVNVTPDMVNSNPYLADIPAVATTVDTAVSFQLVAVDVEGEPSFYLDENTLAANGLSAPVISHADLDYGVDFNTGLVTVTPRNGLTGTHGITVATGVLLNAVDYQVVPITISP
jgi:cyclophilin family peptidyl-prolyl cis-trans isomerase